MSVKTRIKLGVSGACGKMGTRILALAGSDPDFKVSLALDRIGHPQIGEKISGIEVVSDRALLRTIDCLIDFSSPEATLANLEDCARFKKAIVIGTTGFSQEQKQEIARRAKEIPVVFSPNMSIGVNLLFALVKDAAAALPDDYKISIVEAHHVHKKDAPSGTAKFLAEIIEAERGTRPEDIKSIREAEIVGDHDVIFDSPVDTIVLRHHAKTRDIFVQGALKAAKFIVTKKRDLFGMQDVLCKSSAR